MKSSYTTVTLWIPDSTASHIALHDIVPGSAIVSAHPVGAQVLCYLEGNLYGAENIKTYADRVLHAASRLRTGYPTSAVRSISRSAIIPVGTFDDSFGEVVIQDTRTSALASWLDVPVDALRDELSTTGSAHQLAARTLREMESTSTGKMQADWLRRHGPAPYRTQS
jgi:hypothetical protein